MSGSRPSWPDDRRVGTHQALIAATARRSSHAKPVTAEGALAGFAGRFEGGGGAAERVGADRLGRALAAMWLFIIFREHIAGSFTGPEFIGLGGSDI